VPIAAPIAAPTAALASDRGCAVCPQAKAIARRGGRLLLLRLVAVSLATGYAAAVRADVDKVSDRGERVFAAELELGAGIESYRNPIAFIGDEGAPIGLARGARRVSSPFREATLSLDMALPSAGGWAWTGAYLLEARRSSGLHGLDHDRHTLALGATHELDDADLGAEILFERLDVGGGDFRRHALGLRLEYLVQQDERSAQGLTLEWKRYRHDFPDDIEDGDRVSLAWARRSVDEHGGGWRTKLAAAEMSNRWGYDDFSYRELVARIERVFVPAPEWTLSLGIAPRWTRFGGAAPDRDFTRDDRRLAGIAGVSRALGERASLQCEAEHGRQYSNAAQARSRWNIVGCSLRLVL
jgi:hypothetical protein